MLNKRIEKIASAILDECGINHLPIPIERVVNNRGLEIKIYDLGETSGVLVIENGKGTIGVNPNESKVRKRFTIAHELGHYELHRDGTNGVFIDKQFKVEFRNHNSSTGEFKKEQEANAFAAAVLMPEKFILKEIKNLEFDLSEDFSLKELAQVFNVSVAAISYRLANLNLL